MATKDIQESQQQSQGVTIGTQGNADQPTPLGDDLTYRREGSKEDQLIPNQEKSSAANQQKEERGDA